MKEWSKNNPQEEVTKRDKVADFDKFKDEKERMQKILNESKIHPDEQPPIIETHVHTNYEVSVIGLIEHHSKSAMEELHRILNQKEKPELLIIEGLGNNAPEVQYATEKAKAMNIRTVDIIASSYNQAIAEAAGVKTKDAVAALILAELKRYEDNIEIINEHIGKNFNIDNAVINVLYQEISKNLDTEISKAKDNFNRLLQVSNDISWHSLQQLNIDGKVIAMVGEEHAKIFDLNFEPSKKYSQEEIDKIKEEIRLLESGVKNIVSPPDETQSILTLLGNEEFFEEWNLLEGKLKKDPNNNILKQKLKNLLIPDYEELMREKNYFHASQRAESMLKYGIDGARELLEKPLRADYEDLIKKKNYFYASQRAEKLKKLLGVEDADELIRKAKEKTP